MKITELRFFNIRNHQQTEIEFDKQLNIICGLNGSGKTSVLEAISICSYSKSFQQASDVSLIRYGESFYQTDIQAINDLKINYFAKVRSEINQKKEISSSFGSRLSARDLIGEMPLIVLSPDLKLITSGTPQDRRDFIDKILCQSSRSYFDKLMNFKKILKQRNNLLTQIKLEINSARIQLPSWTELFIKSGAELIVAREKFIRDFREKFILYYSTVSHGKESVELNYYPHGNEFIDNSDDLSLIIEKLKVLSDNLSRDEIRRGVSLFGPQKDELIIQIGKGIARESASQGQHKSLLIALKFAEFEFLKEIRNETPIVLLDDIFSELDPERIEQVISLLSENSAQTFITVTDVSFIKKIINQHLHSVYSVNNGMVTQNS